MGTESIGPLIPIKQWFSVRNKFVLQGTCDPVRVEGHLVGRGQGCC